MEIDEIIIEILSFSISGIGLFNFVSKYDVPELNYTFFGKNIFSIKANIIEETLNWSYVIPTVFGLFLLPIKEIYSDVIKDRIFQNNFQYWLILIIFIVLSFFMYKVLTCLGLFIARKKWMPEIINAYRHAMDEIEDQNLLISNPTKAEKIINLIEKILEIDQTDYDMAKRYTEVKRFFN